MDAFDPDLVIWIKKLRQHRGVMSKRPDFRLDLFGADNWDDMLRIVQTCLWLISYAEPRDALENALGMTAPDLSGSTSVIERRQRFSAVSGVSVRTLERREELGAELLAMNITKMVLNPDFQSLISELNDAAARLFWAAKWAGVKIDDGSRDALADGITRVQNDVLAE